MCVSGEANSILYHLGFVFFHSFFSLFRKQFLARQPPFPFCGRSQPGSNITHNDGGHFDARLTDDAQLAAVKVRDLGKNAAAE